MKGLREAPAITAQVVLYNTPLPDIWRVLEGLSAAIVLATKRGVISSGGLFLGDCSAVPGLSSRDIEDLASHSSTNGLSFFDYYFFDQNLGHSGGHNLLAEKADSEFLLFLNPDTYPAPTMLLELLQGFDEPMIGLAEARQIPLEHPKEYDPWKGDTSWASGCALLTRRAVFRSVGGFDQMNFPTYCNDVDLSWRLKLAGFRIILVARAVVFHDKEISQTGHPVPAPTETYESTLGRLLLATRYMREDIVAETIHSVESAGTDEHKAALEEYRRRQVDRRLPGALDATGVAQFIGGEYAFHRF